MDDITQYDCPAELVAIFANASYRRWLRRRAQDLRQRDLEAPQRITEKVTNCDYYKAIDDAVRESARVRSDGSNAPGAGEHDAGCNLNGDYYTGEFLNWALLFSSGDGERRAPDYPTIDHVDPERLTRDRAPVFAICRDDTNKMKTDMALENLHRKITLMRDRGHHNTANVLERIKQARTAAH